MNNLPIKLVCFALAITSLSLLALESDAITPCLSDYYTNTIDLSGCDICGSQIDSCFSITSRSTCEDSYVVLSPGPPIKVPCLWQIPPTNPNGICMLSNTACEFCKDSDNGENLFELGTAKDALGSKTDRCINGHPFEIHEAICENFMAVYAVTFCPNGNVCHDGKCEPSTCPVGPFYSEAAPLQGGYPGFIDRVANYLIGLSCVGGGWQTYPIYSQGSLFWVASRSW